jgi:hypothetical protein
MGRSTANGDESLRRIASGVIARRVTRIKEVARETLTEDV